MIRLVFLGVIFIALTGLVVEYHNHATKHVKDVLTTLGYHDVKVTELGPAVCPTEQTGPTIKPSGKMFLFAAKNAEGRARGKLCVDSAGNPTILPLDIGEVRP